MTHPAYGRLRSVLPFASVVLENNPGPMTLDGTNTWIVRAPGADACVVVDPGELDEAHLALVAEQAPVELVLLTHHHHDHSGGAREFASRVGAPLRAFDPSLCWQAPSLSDGESFSAGGVAVSVRHTPGHTDDSVCFGLSHSDSQAMLTGDSVLGRGTTVIAGTLADYLSSLRSLTSASPGTVVLPGHGPELPDLPAVAASYLAHREERLDQVRAALTQLGPDPTPRQVVEIVYADVDKSVWPAAEWSVAAQLEYLRSK
ncbi:MBL fold metallo-hydrolase [Labedaea rhizosphaerae]|uniref:Glyoxylase-like metal-dependent hydrolase (Beta-lactamase superfamily II) n=1 Tax=Labedaea rhizosphaerae TaxID=598644 RepID=A0A4R6SMJ4_LABRH|nr:MBL fold metallo-hydrolase [Labedaea rhizosphaerae]TDQ04780.1 glyoxylase-like metal-dependent hydrolase (beta-lactamase superfamily II) [Labedaea rhizosphaerae]